MRVLLVGMNYLPNQFSRAIESYGLECVHISGDPDGRLEMADAAVLAIVHSSHGKFYKAKDFCKANGIPMFVSETGFSRIKDQFENWLQEKRGYVARVAKPVTALGDAFAKAKIVSAAPTLPAPALQIKPPELPKQIEAKPVDKSVDNTMSLEQLGPREYSRQCMQLVAKLMDEGVDAYETVKRVIDAGFKTTAGGSPWDEQKMHAFRYQAKLKGLTKAKVGENYKKVAKVVKPAAPMTVTKAAPAVEPKCASGFLPQISADEKDKLMGRVFASKLPMERKYQLVEEIHAGLITSDTSVMPVRLDGKLSLIKRSILAVEDEPLIILDKVTAIAIVQSIKDIEAFINDK